MHAFGGFYPSQVFSRRKLNLGGDPGKCLFFLGHSEWAWRGCASVATLYKAMLIWFDLTVPAESMLAEVKFY